MLNDNLEKYLANIKKTAWQEEDVCKVITKAN